MDLGPSGIRGFWGSVRCNQSLLPPFLFPPSPSLLLLKVLFIGVKVMMTMQGRGEVLTRRAMTNLGHKFYTFF